MAEQKAIQELEAGYFKSLNEARLLDAREAIRAGLLINGGAASGVLAFSAQLAGKGCGNGVAHLVSSALVLFALGVTAASVAAAIAYLTNHGYAEAKHAEIMGRDHISVWMTATRWHGIALLAMALSLVSFFVGVVLTALAL